MKKVKTEGWTLLETVVVMVVIAVGASLAIPNLGKGVEQKRADSAIETLRSISNCIRIYKLEHGIETLTSADALTFGKLDTGTADGIIGNGCMDRAQFEKTFDFPERDDGPLADPVILTATANTGNNRLVCLTPAGTIARTGKVYDQPDTGDCVNVTTGFRVFDE